MLLSNSKWLDYGFILPFDSNVERDVAKMTGQEDSYQILIISRAELIL